MINAGLLTTNINLYDVDHNEVSLTPEQFKIFAANGFAFYNQYDHQYVSLKIAAGKAQSRAELDGIHF